MDGLLVVDKPSGPTSHDVVARTRRALRERSIGHTGTLDPMASGVLPLLIGRATRLARFMTAEEKRYDAVVLLGFATDTADATGQTVSPLWGGAWPDADAINSALAAFRGTFLQQPPAYSAKKVGGERSYRLARRAKRGATLTSVDSQDRHPEPTLPLPAQVTAFNIDITAIEGNRVSLAVTCSSGFYVRSLAHDLGQALGVGGHLASLRRTATSGVTLEDAVTLDELESGLRAAETAVLPMARMLPHFSAVHLNRPGAARARQGRELGPADSDVGLPAMDAGPGPFRLIDPDGMLIGLADRSDRPGLLHPAVILM
ncbi:MAG: tRNA pseudouridine(55) synthase TruB [Vicinamibacterales bacterium]